MRESWRRRFRSIDACVHRRMCPWSNARQRCGFPSHQLFFDRRSLARRSFNVRRMLFNQYHEAHASKHPPRPQRGGGGGAATHGLRSDDHHERIALLLPLHPLALSAEAAGAGDEWPRSVIHRHLRTTSLSAEDPIGHVVERSSRSPCFKQSPSSLTRGWRGSRNAWASLR